MFAPGGTVYCATKSAVRALTEGLWMELHSENIRCTIISPGAVESELKDRFKGGYRRARGGDPSEHVDAEDRAGFAA